MGRDTQCKWCNAWINFVERSGRPIAIDKATKKQHFCNPRAIASTIAVPREIAEKRKYAEPNYSRYVHEKVEPEFGSSLPFGLVVLIVLVLVFVCVGRLLS